MNKLLIIVVLICSLLTKEIIVSGYKKFYLSSNFYDHKYFFALTDDGYYAVGTHSAGKSICTSLDAYLVTITSLDELNFIRDRKTTDSQFHISGQAQPENLFEWYFDSGPEEGILMYNLSTDYCYGHCPWGKLEPSLMDSETVLATSIVDQLNTSQVLINNITPTKTLYILCEESSMNNFAKNIPYYKEGVGYNNFITFDNIDPDFTKKTITFTTISSGTVRNCSNPIRIGPKLGKCELGLTLPFNRYFISLINDTVTQKQYYQQTAMNILYVRPNFGGVATAFQITVDTPSTDTSLVYFGRQQTPCSNYSYDPYIIACNVVIPTGDTYLPVTISLRTLSTSTFKTGIYDPVTGLGYKFITILSTFPLVYNAASRFELMGLQGYAQGITTSNLASLAVSTISYPSPYNFVWQNLNPCNSNSYCFAETGPQTDLLITDLYRSNSGVALPTYAANQRLSFDLLTSTYSARDMSSLQGFVVEFSGFAPEFAPFGNYTLNQVLVPNIPTQGTNQYCGIKIMNAGLGFGGFTFQDIYFSNSARYLSRVDIYKFKFPSGYGVQKLYFVNSKHEKAINSLDVYYNKPEIESIKPSTLSFLGGMITIYGSSFSDTVEVISVSSNDHLLQCNDISLLLNHSTIECRFQSSISVDIKEIDIKVTVSGQESNIHTIKYTPYPKITSYSPLVRYSNEGTSKFNITVLHLNINSLSIFLEYAECKDPRIINSKTIECTFTNNELPEPPSDYFRPLNLSLHYPTLTAINSIFFYTNSTTDSSGLTCPMNCSNGSGICDKSNGICNCFPGFGSVDCSISILPPPIRPQYNNIDTSSIVADNHESEFKFTFIGINFGNDIYYFNDTSNGSWMKQPSKYSDLEYSFIKESEFSVGLEINFTVNSESYIFASQEISLYPYSSNYRITMEIPDQGNIDVEPIFLLEYNSPTSDDNGCFNQGINNENPLIYEIVGKDSIYSVKFTQYQQIYSQNSEYLQKQLIGTISSDSITSTYENVKILQTKTGIIYQGYPSPKYTFEINTALATISKDISCNNFEIERTDWKTPLIISIAVIGSVVIVGAIIFVIKKKKAIDLMKIDIRHSQSAQMVKLQNINTSNASISNNNSGDIQYI